MDCPLVGLAFTHGQSLAQCAPRSTRQFRPTQGQNPHRCQPSCGPPRTPQGRRRQKRSRSQRASQRGTVWSTTRRDRCCSPARRRPRPERHPALSHPPARPHPLARSRSHLPAAARARSGALLAATRMPAPASLAAAGRIPRATRLSTLAPLPAHARLPQPLLLALLPLHPLFQRLLPLAAGRLRRRIRKSLPRRLPFLDCLPIQLAVPFLACVRGSDMAWAARSTPRPGLRRGPSLSSSAASRFSSALSYR
jgi:hypothetical protein